MSEEDARQYRLTACVHRGMQAGAAPMSVLLALFVPLCLLYWLLIVPFLLLFTHAEPLVCVGKQKSGFILATCRL